MTIDHSNHDKIDDLNETDTHAKLVANVLDAQTQKLDMRILKRLEDSRNLALAAHTSKTTGQQVNSDGSLSSWFSWSQHPRLMSAGLLSVALLVGLMVTHNYNRQIEQGDAFLLGAELPPEAFVDRGFEPWLNAKAEL
jgi:Protein of unknown function (DUF3619)